MPVRVASLADIPATKLPGRDLQWLVSPETIGSEQLGVAIMTCPAYSTVRPCHGHGSVEEVLLVLEGEGEAWVDGETAPFKAGNAVLLPAGSKHQVRNTGPGVLRTASIFATARPMATYVLYEGEGFQE